LEKIVEKKKKFQHNEDILMNQLKKLYIKEEIKTFKRSMNSDSETSESVIVIKIY